MNSKLIIIGLASLLLLTACEKVITLDIPDKSRQYVIEGVITDQAPPYYVYVSKSVSLSQSGNTIPVNNAQVTITDNQGIKDTLHLDAAGSGRYVTTTTVGQAGRSYQLVVEIGGYSFTSSSIMPAPVHFDKLAILSGAGIAGASALVPTYRDPAATADYYQLKLVRNGISTSTIIVEDDLLINGNQVSRPLFDQEVKSKDTFQVYLLNIDKGVYNYFFSLGQNTGGGPNSAATPANPVSNMKGGCLGYFSAHTIQRKDIIAP
jgi:Domain of unknown function (DUF4249)